MSHESLDPRDQDQHQMDEPEAPQEAQSRRNFLRAAVVGSAVAATAVGAGAVVARATPLGPRLLGNVLPVSSLTSGQVVFDPCFEDTMFQPLASFSVHDGHPSPGSFFLWFTAYNLPAGTYTIVVSPDPGASTKPFKLASDIHGNASFLFKLAANTATQCPSSNPTNQVRQAFLVDSLFPYTFTGANSDLQLKVHLAYNDGDLAHDTTFTYKGTLKNGSNVTLATATISVVAHAS